MRRYPLGLLVVCAALVLSSIAFADIQYRILVNGKLLVPEVPPQNVNGRLLVPLRAVSEALGAEVGWNAETSTVIITTPQPRSLDATAVTEIAELSKLRNVTNAALRREIEMMDMRIQSLQYWTAGVLSTATLEEVWKGSSGGAALSVGLLDDMDGYLASSPTVASELSKQGVLTPVQIRQTVERVFSYLQEAKDLAFQGRTSYSSSVNKAIELRNNLFETCISYDATIHVRTLKLLVTGQ